MLAHTHLKLTEETPVGPIEIRLDLKLQDHGEEIEAAVSAFPTEFQNSESITMLLQNSLDVLQGAAEGFAVEVEEPTEASLDDVLESIVTTLAVIQS